MRTLCPVRTTEGGEERNGSDPCVLGLQVILKCHRIRCYVTAQGSSVIQINSILLAHAGCIDKNMTQASAFRGDVKKCAGSRFRSSMNKMVTKTKGSRCLWIHTVHHIWCQILQSALHHQPRICMKCSRPTETRMFLIEPPSTISVAHAAAFFF